MTAGDLVTRLRAVGAKLVSERKLVLPAGLTVAEQIVLTRAAKQHAKVVIAAFNRPAATAEVAAMLAEVEQLGGPATVNLIEDAKAGRIRPDDLLKWVRAWHRERLRAVATQLCQRCGTAIDCWLLSNTCRNCIAKET